MSDHLPSPSPQPDDTNVVPVDLRDYVVFDTDAPRRSRVFATDVLTVDLWCLEPGQSTGVLHLPDIDTAYTVVGGYGWFVTDQGEIGLDPLGAILVPADTVHGLDNRGADPLIVLASASPPDVATTDLRVDEPADSAGTAVTRDPGGSRGLANRLRARRG